MSDIHIIKDNEAYKVYNYSKEFTQEQVEEKLAQHKFELNVINWLENNAPQPGRILEYLEVFQGLTSIQGILEKKERLQNQIDKITLILNEGE